MDKIYIFSKNEFVITHKQETHNINKYSSIVIQNCLPNDTVEVIQNIFGYNKSLTIFPFTAISNNFYNTYTHNNKKYIELISIDNDNVIQEINTKNCSVKFCFNTFLLTYKQKCHSFTFNTNTDTDNFVIELNNCLYVFNNLNFIKIDLNTLISSYLITEKLSKNDDNIEILCKFQKNNTYFLLFCFNLNENTLSVKKLKNENNQVYENSLPYVLFYLSKFDFEDAEKFLSNNIEYKKVKEYFSEYDELLEIDNSFILYSKTKLTTVSFNFNNHLIEDID